MVALNLSEYERARWLTHGMTSSSLIWYPFPPFLRLWLDEFSLREVPCVFSWVQWWDTSALTVFPHHYPPGIMGSSASLFPVPCPELTNVCHLILCASAQVLHHGRNSFCWSLHPCHREGRGKQLVSSTVCWSQKFSWVLFWTQEIFIKSSQIF